MPFHLEVLNAWKRIFHQGWWWGWSNRRVSIVEDLLCCFKRLCVIIGEVPGGAWAPADSARAPACEVETTSGVTLSSVRDRLGLPRDSSSSYPDSTVRGGGAVDLEDTGFSEDKAALFLFGG